MKEKVQKGGRFLSGMVMPNIGAFIAWGLITALFIPTGWLPNERLGTMVGPMIKYLLPLLIGYTGGKMTGGNRGAVVGVIATFGAIQGADITMFMGAMIAGPVGGLCIKWFDKAMEGKIKAGFEMLVNNFSAGIIGGILSLIFFLVVGPICVEINNALGAAVQFFVDLKILPLVAIFVEPAKVLFLNNAINFGIFTPIGTEQAAEIGKSIFFMIESNPGPGFGLLLAYCIAGKGSAKNSAPGAAIIHFFGGIHEIYFPYILMNPILILATIAGNAVSILTLVVFNGGTTAAPSPGSVIAELLMTPKGGFFANILAIALSTLVSGVLGVVLLRLFAKEDEDIEDAQAKMKQMKAVSKGQESGLSAPSQNQAAATSSSTPSSTDLTQTVSADMDTNESEAKTDFDMATVKKIAFACDAGMGSSAMGATTLRKKIKTAGLEGIEVIHAPVSEIPSDIQLVVTHRELEARAKTAAPQARIVPITNFMGAPEYEVIVKELVAAKRQ